MATWIVQIQCPDKKLLWVGNYTAEGREDAKRAARLFVSEHFPLDTKILAIARGHITLRFEEAPIPYTEE